MSANPESEPTTEEILKEVAANNPSNVQSEEDKVNRAWIAWLQGDDKAIVDLPKDFPKVRAFTEMLRGRKIYQDILLQESIVTADEFVDSISTFVKIMMDFFGRQNPEELADAVKRYEYVTSIEHPKIHSIMAQKKKETA